MGHSSFFVTKRPACTREVWQVAPGCCCPAMASHMEGVTRNRRSIDVDMHAGVNNCELGLSTQKLRVAKCEPGSGRDLIYAAVTPPLSQQNMELRCPRLIIRKRGGGYTGRLLADSYFELVGNSGETTDWSKKGKEKWIKRKKT